MKKKILYAAGLGLALLTGGASAAVVGVWDYEVNSIWTDATFKGSTHTVTDEVLSWGVPWASLNPLDKQSSLTINDNPVVGEITTSLPGAPGSIGITNSMTHDNFVISSVDSLLSGKLASTVTLKEMGTDDGPDPMTFDFSIAFMETPNSGTCAVDSPVPCNDIFVVEGGLPDFSFNYDGQAYTMALFPLMGDWEFLPDAACAAVGAAPGCFGFTTVEDQSNTVDFGFTLTAVPVPAAAWLFLSALVGLGFTARRKSV